jgi:hypothetical protein
MTQSLILANSKYPFGAIEEERKSEISSRAGFRNSMSMHSSRRESETDSFVSAPDSPSALQRQILD